jgi:hypothetical protein
LKRFLIRLNIYQICRRVRQQDQLCSKVLSTLMDYLEDKLTPDQNAPVQYRDLTIRRDWRPDGFSGGKFSCLKRFCAGAWRSSCGNHNY